MTRCSDLRAVLVLAALAAPANADPLRSDAFGLFDPAASTPERLDWAGWRGKGNPVPPEEPDRLVIFAGPKSMVAGKDPGHVVAIAMDRHGNLVQDGSESVVTVAGAENATVTHGGIADLLVPPQTLAADLFVGVAVGARQSPMAMLSVTADIASIRPELAEPLPEIGLDTEFTLSTRPLADRFGNAAPDGTGVTAVLQHADGSFSLAQGFVLQDSAATRFIARDIPGRAEATLTLGRQASSALSIDVKTPNPTGMPALVLESAPDIAATRLRLGPFLTTAGYALTDGAQVNVTADHAAGDRHTETAWVMDGEVNILLPFSPVEELSRLTVSSPLGPMDLTAQWSAAAQALASGSEVTP